MTADIVHAVVYLFAAIGTGTTIAFIWGRMARRNGK